MKNENARVFSDQQITLIIDQGRHGVTASNSKNYEARLSELAISNGLGPSRGQGINTLNPKGRAFRFFRFARQRQT